MVRRTKMVCTPSPASIIYGSVRIKTPRYTDTLFCASRNHQNSTSSFHQPWFGDSFKSSSLMYFQRAALAASHDHGSCSCRSRYSLLTRHPESIIAAAPKAKPIAASHFRGISSDCSRESSQGSWMYLYTDSLDEWVSPSPRSLIDDRFKEATGFVFSFLLEWSLGNTCLCFYP